MTHIAQLCFGLPGILLRYTLTLTLTTRMRLVEVSFALPDVLASPSYAEVALTIALRKVSVVLMDCPGARLRRRRRDCIVSKESNSYGEAGLITC